MFKEIPKSNIVLRPLKVYKSWMIDEGDVQISYGVNTPMGSFEDGDDKSGIIYRSIQSQFYRNSATASILTEVGRRKSYASTDERNLENEFVLILIPQIMYGEGVKVGSLSITSGSTTYSDDGYSNLVSGGDIYGNVLYDRGYVILTKDVVSGSFNQFQIQFNSTKTIYENEIFISILENEFNTSQNPTSMIDVEYETGIVVTKGEHSYSNSYTQSFSNLKSANINPNFFNYNISSSIDPTGSYLAPYITTIGLYDDEMNMVAVAKLANPIKSYPDYPLNFIIRIDT
jgi:hypothetical protein